MKANELRIGNYVNEILSGVKQVEAIEILAMVQCEVAKTPAKFIVPITLTEEWLLKFGFEKHDGNQFKNNTLAYWVKDGVCLFFNESPPENTYLICMGDFISDFKGGGEYVAIGRNWITCVHTLQNFFYANTGKELVPTTEKEL